MDSIAYVMTQFFDIVPLWLAGALTVVSAASAITALTPSPADDHWLAALRRILEMLALNIGHARPGRGNRPE